VFYVNAAGQPIVVLNTQKAAADLLDRRAGSTLTDRATSSLRRFSVAAWRSCFRTMGHCARISDRIRLPTFLMSCTYVDGGECAEPPTKVSAKSVVESFKTPQFNEAVLLASGLLAQPATLDNHLRRVAASMIMSVTYDTPPIVSELDSGVKAINDFVARLTRAALPGSHFVEFFPWMRYIPSRWGISSNKADLEFNSLHVLDLRNGSATQSIGTRKIRQCLKAYSMASAKSRSVLFLRNATLWLTLLQSKGIDRPSLVGTLIKDADKYGLSDRENSWLAAIM
jgi:hypothetical protein